ncbi:MAG: tetraacyldisaccharide 4'-kinase [Alphaproteobacteria bacterium]|nr:tetraacyldisaccharide 4'-kinase [Alphaproteobacteria bacterium]
MQPPDFWYEDDSILARALDPIGRMVGAITTARAARANQPRAPIPVISIGGFTVGGAGKTPAAMAIVGLLRDAGRKPAVVLRGYGGSFSVATRVDPARHTSADVGDEALLHAALGPTYVAARRIAGCTLAAREGADVAVLDDGHQHPGLHKDLAILIADGADPFGNEHVFPAGPLREKPDDAARRAQALIFVGDDATNLASRTPAHLKLFRARLEPSPEALALSGRKVVAFAGIGRPAKFFRMLEEIGARVVARHPFEDHHRFDLADIQPILDEAFALDAVPVTTAKDAVRLPTDQRPQVDVITTTLVLEDEGAVGALLRSALG